jgi:hypothetical protein
MKIERDPFSWYGKVSGLTGPIRVAIRPTTTGTMVRRG